MRAKKTAALALGALAAALFVVGEGGCSAILGVPDLFYDSDATAGSPPGDAGGRTDTNAPDGGTSVACVDASADPSNCGTCGHSCLGGGCVGGRCTPAAIAIYDGGSPGVISVQKGYVYWVDNGLNPSGKATFLRVPTNAPPVSSPTPVETVATSAASTVTELHRMADGLLYFVQPGGDDPTGPTAFMERLDLTTSAITRVVQGVPYGQGISDDTQNLYWVDTNGSAFEVRKLDTSGNAGSTVINDVDHLGPYVTAWAQGRLFWGEDACKLDTTNCPVVGCTATPSSTTCTTTNTIIPGTGDVSALVTNDAVLFAGTARGGIYQYGLNSGSTLTTIPGPQGTSENEPFVLNMAVDARDLYWVSRSASTKMGAINGCRLTSSGGVVAQCETPYVIQDNVKQPNGIALDDTAVYFGVTSTGTIYRLAR